MRGVASPLIHIVTINHLQAFVAHLDQSADQLFAFTERHVTDLRTVAKRWVDEELKKLGIVPSSADRLPSDRGQS